MEPRNALEILSPLLSHAIEIAVKAGGSEDQLSEITEALETLNFAIAWAQLTWDQSFPAWLQFIEEQKRKQTPRAERRRLEVVKR